MKRLATLLLSGLLPLALLAGCAQKAPEETPQSEEPVIVTETADPTLSDSGPELEPSATAGEALNDTAFEWDSDGDGAFEPFAVAYVENEDGTSAIDLTYQGATGNQTVRLEGAQGIRDVREGMDGQERYLTITYLDAAGAALEATLRFVDGQLVLAQ